MDLFETTNGPNWKANTGWGSEDPCTEPSWTLIVCTPDDIFVPLLGLDFTRLEGVLPPGLGSLKAIFELSMQQNLLRGPIPAKLSQLFSLHILNFAYQCDPSSGIGRFPGVQRLGVLHRDHHNPALMAYYNFNIKYPIWDWLFGTRYPS